MKDVHQLTNMVDDTEKEKADIGDNVERKDAIDAAHGLQDILVPERQTGEGRGE